MKLPQGTLVAIVDGKTLILFRNTGQQHIHLTEETAPKIPERLSGAAGRGSSNANPDDKTQAEDGFAMGVADSLNHWAMTGRFEHLLVIAAPKTLGQLRKGWHKQTSARIVGEISKELTGHSQDQIRSEIEQA